MYGVVFEEGFVSEGIIESLEGYVFDGVVVQVIQEKVGFGYFMLFWVFVYDYLFYFYIKCNWFCLDFLCYFVDVCFNWDDCEVMCLIGFWGYCVIIEELWVVIDEVIFDFLVGGGGSFVIGYFDIDFSDVDWQVIVYI